MLPMANTEMATGKTPARTTFSKAGIDLLALSAANVSQAEPRLLRPGWCCGTNGPRHKSTRLNPSPVCADSLAQSWPRGVGLRALWRPLQIPPSTLQLADFTRTTGKIEIALTYSKQTRASISNRGFRRPARQPSGGPWPPWQLIAMTIRRGSESRATNRSQGTEEPTTWNRAKKNLIATPAKLEIAITRSRQRTSHFLIATKNAFSHSEICTTNRNPSDRKRSRSEGDPSGEISILPWGRDNFSRSSAIESLGASGVPEVYNPGRFLRRYP